MAKKRKGRNTQPTKNKFWSNIVQSYGLSSNPAQTSANLIQKSANPSQTIAKPNQTTTNTGQPSSNQKPAQKSAQPEIFQGHHNEHDTMMDLIDDTSPNIPMTKTLGAGPQRPGNKGIQQKHQDPQSKIVLGLNTATQNKTEDKSAPNPVPSVPNAPQKAVVGHASDIKLFNTKAVAVVTEKPALLPTPSTAGPNNPITVQDNTPVSVAKSVQQAFDVKYLGGKTINTRITRLATATPMKPQQYKLPATQPAFDPTPPVLPELPDVRQMLPPHQSGPRELYNYMYPKGIPRSFLSRPAAPDQLNNQYSSLIPPLMSDLSLSWPQSSTPMEVNLSAAYTPSSEVENPIYGNAGPQTVEQPYSPSDVYVDNNLGNTGEEERAGSESPDLLEPGQKRLSAFRRLGPLTQPKKPKMTINLLCNKEQSVREVVDETEQKYVPVHLRDDIISSSDETVAEYLNLWPWEKGLTVRKTVMPRNSKSVMMLEQEQMEEIYEKSYLYIQISVQGYPRDWTKEMLLDTLLDAVNGKSFIPLFIEFAPQECKFLVIKAQMALNALHKAGLIIRKNGAELTLAISQTELTTVKNGFVPKLVLRKRLAMGYDGERSLDLSEFTLKDDISHFIYYPLNRANNQTDLVMLPKSPILWNYLTELNLSRNKLTSIDGFNLPSTTPKLRHLDLSFNYFERVTFLLRSRDLNLLSLKLEGNPLCRDYTDPDRYVKVLKMIFPPLREIDGVRITPFGEMPTFYRNYCPEDAKPIIDRFLEVYFPLLDATDKDRAAIQDLYHDNACMTITYRYKLRYGPIYRQFRTIFSRSRVIEEGDIDTTIGAAEIARLINKWPPLKHDPFTFTVDVIMHNDSLTIFKVAGIVKLTSESLADDEHLISFARTFVLHSPDGVEFKIVNEMVYWDQPTQDYANTAFQITTVRSKRLSLKLETPPDEDLKEQLVQIFMQLTELSKSASERCLENRDWHLKSALEYFVKLLKLDEIEILTKGI